MSDKLTDALEAAFAEATRRYRERGFQRRVGFGSKPALINVDLANAWTRPGNPFTCEHIDDQVIPAVQKLLVAFRKYGFPIVHVTTCYQVTDRNNPNTDMGLWHNKIPVDVVNANDTSLWAIDSRIAPDSWRAATDQEARKRIPRYLSRWLPARRGCRHHSGDRRYGVGMRASNGL